MRQIVPVMLLLALISLPAAGGDADGGPGDRTQAYYHFLLAKGYEFEHLYDEAVRELQQALQYEAENSFIHSELASLYQRLGRGGKALEHGHAAIEADPDNVEARIFLGMLFFKKSRQEENLRQEMTEKAIEQYRAAIGLDPMLEDAFLDLSHIYNVDGRSDEALALLEDFLERSPYSERALFALGNIHWSRQQWEKALNEYLRILEINPDSVRALLDVADTCRNLDRPEEALRHYLTALVQNPESFNILNQIGTCYEELQELDQAAIFFRKALAVKPDSLEVVDALGNVALMDRRYLEATGHYLVILEAEPDRMVTRFNLARSYKGMGEERLALAHLDRLHRQLTGLFDRGEGSQELIHFQRLVLEQLANIHVTLEQYDKALAVLREADAQAGATDLEVRHNLARVHHLQGDLDAALQVLSAVRQDGEPWTETDLLELEMRFDAGREEGCGPILDRLQREAEAVGPESDLWLRLVALLNDNGEHNRAARLLERITAGDQGKTALTLFFLARARMDDGNLEGAGTAIEQGRKRFPDDRDFTYLEGELLLRQEEEESCKALMDRLLAGEESNSDELLRVSLLYSQYERFELARQTLAGGLERFPGDGRLLFQLASVQERLGRAAEAEKTFRRLLALEPDNAQALNYLGYMLAESGQRLDEAIDLVGRALALEPRNGAFLDSMGWALFRAGRTGQAGGYLMDALKLIPEDPTILEHVGDFHMALGHREEAFTHYRKALERGAEDPAALEQKMSPTIDPTGDAP